MMQYRIVEWDERYEVDDKHREWSPGKTKRKGALAFIRLAVHGRSQGAGWRKLVQQAGKAKALAVFGLFCKVLELAGDSQREMRGMFVDDRDANDENDLAWLLNVPRRQIDAALGIMCDIGWITPLSRKSPETSGNSPPTIPTIPTQHNSTQPTKEKTKKFSCRNSDDFRLASLLFDLIRQRKPDIKPPNLETWAKHISLMIRRDDRTPEAIDAVIRWCQKDDFWQNNILSTAKLRKQFDQLQLKMPHRDSPEETLKRLQGKGLL